MSNTDPFDQHGTAAARPAGGQAAVRNDERGASMQGASMQGATQYRDDTIARREPARYQDGGDDRNDRTEPDDIPTRKVRETKPAFLTTEFWFAVGGIAALIAVYLIEDDPSLDLFRTALLATLIGVAYIVSRGLAKAGSRTTRQPEDPRLALEHSSR
jgi:hypothetical protein